jgi:imidazolonepropionase-like amidohydrolase
MAAPNLKMNLAELWAAITLNPAYSLGLSNYGYLAAGSSSCFSLFGAPQVSDITYFWGQDFHLKTP